MVKKITVFQTLKISKNNLKNPKLRLSMNKPKLPKRSENQKEND